MSFQQHFSRFLAAAPERLHFAAHSHHLWPDVSWEAHGRAWEDAAELADGKWDTIFDRVVGAARRHVTRVLNLSRPQTVVFAPNTHELVVRIASCLPWPARILSTDAEFHSFARQSARWEEAGRAVVERVAVEPFDSFPERFAAVAAGGGYDLVYVSQVMYDSGYVVPSLVELLAEVPDDVFVVVDGYHGFMALPTDFAPLQDRAFYLAGGYKYGMAGEGACFLHCPPGFGERPVDTGWFAEFEALESRGGEVTYPDDGGRFWGATFDPSGLYRFVAAMDLWEELGVTVADIHGHVQALQHRFLVGLDGLGLADLGRAALIPPPGVEPRGNFLTFRLPDAGGWYRRLQERGVVTDHRRDRLRIGFGLYHDPADVDELLVRLATD